MSTSELTQRWANQFGLALAPLFGTHDVFAEGSHAVLLDGGYGSFALSETGDKLWRSQNTACWAWSSDLPHHVTVTDEIVAVTRWDNPKIELFSRHSVEDQTESFYSYLVTDRVQSSQRVVEYMLYLFRRMRSLVADAGLPDEQSTDAFLDFLTERIRLERYEVIGRARVAPVERQAGTELLGRLPEKGLASLVDEFPAPTSFQHCRLFPSLAVRHAGSEIFQEAHFELLRAPSPDLFSYAGPAEAASVTRGGAHFTPAALARCVVEQTLLHVEDLATRARLTILDPACGSGSFLQETLRALSRVSFAGDIELVGRDISPAAVSMANFVVRHAAADWLDGPQIHIDVRVADSLNERLPPSDVILMNPPFISWPLLSDLQRQQMREVLGLRLQGRGDLSMAFVIRGLDVLKAGGALGVLLPASLLTLEAAADWRRDILDRANLYLVASMGDYGLFAHALVQVAAAVMARHTDPSSFRGTTTALVTTDTPEATGDALRALRRSNQGDIGIGEDDAWRLFDVPTKTFEARPTWRLITPRAERALSRLVDAGAAPISDLFDVKQGVRTGDRRAFVLQKREYDILPERERRYFRPAVMNESIRDGRVQSIYWLFYPYNADGAIFTTEDHLFAEVPTYATVFLLPRRDGLIGRKSRRGSAYRNWWELSERRATWAFDSAPRLVSKYFGRSGGFATDLAAEMLVVQGYVWFPKFVRNDEQAEEEAALSVDELLCGYSCIMNSTKFGRVLEIFSPHVAGGQFDLSPRYVNPIPIPDLATLARDEGLGRLVVELAGLGRDPRPDDGRWAEEANLITTTLYGADLFDRV